MRPRLCAFVVFLLLLPAAASGTLPAKWRELEPMFGGPVNRISVDSAGTVYLSTPGGVFKSTDAGASWVPARGDLPSVPTGGAILADPVTAGTVYVWIAQGLFRTTDGGATWTRLPLELPTGVYVQEIAVTPSDPTHVFVATWGDYVYRSLDGGATWERRSSGLSGGWSGPSYITAIAVDPVNADRVYTSTWRGLLFRSDDGATTWSQMSDSGTWANTQMYVARSSPNILYTLHDEYWFGRGTVLKSTDHGDTWSAMARPNGPGETWQLAVDPTDEDVVYAASSGGLYKSLNGGTSWSRVLQPSGQTPMGSVGLDPGNVSRVYGGHAYSGFYRSLDAGASWEESNSGLSATGFTGLDIIRDAPATVYAGVRGLGFLKSTDGGETWSVIGTAQGLGGHFIGTIAGHPGNPDVLAVTTSTSEGHLWKSVDGGATFTETATGYGPRWIRFNPHTPSVVNASVSDWQGGFLRSADTAASWSVPYFWYIYPLNYDYHPTLPNVVFSLGDQYTGAALTTLHVVWSNDGGATWTGNALTTSLWGSDLALDQNDPATLYVASELSGEGTRGVYKFSVAYSGGNVASVTRVPGTFNSGLTDTKVLRLVYDKVHSALYAATPSGLFRSLDQAASWTPLPGLPHPPTPWMAVTPDGSRLLVATSGGIWELGPNAAPVADDQSVSTAEDAEVDVTLTGSDPDGGTLTFAIVSGPEHGALSGTPPAVTYTPDPDYFGPDGFTFEADDGLASDQGAVSLTVTPVNDPPWFDPIADASVPYSGGPQAVEVAGLSAGPANESDQSVTLAAVSGNPDVAADPAITWSGPVLLDEVFLGGEGDQRSRGLALAGGAAWLSADTATKVDALVARYDLPLGAPPAWTRSWPDWPGDTGWDELPGIGVSEDGIYMAGRSWSQTTDGVGDKEAKSVVVKLSLDGSAGGEATGAVWVYKPHYHPYTGHEGFNAGTAAAEGGQTYVYAAGGAQVNFCNHRPMAMKVDASGSEVWRYADTASTCGDAMAFALAVDGGSVYLAGRVVESGTEYPYLAKLDAATGTVAWTRQGSADFPAPGSFLAVAVSSGTVYAAGWKAGAGGEDYLLDAWDADGSRVPLSGERRAGRADHRAGRDRPGALGRGLHPQPGRSGRQRRGRVLGRGPARDRSGHGRGALDHGLRGGERPGRGVPGRGRRRVRPVRGRRVAQLDRGRQHPGQQRRRAPPLRPLHGHAPLLAADPGDRHVHGDGRRRPGGEPPLLPDLHGHGDQRSAGGRRRLRLHAGADTGGGRRARQRLGSGGRPPGGGRPYRSRPWHRELRSDGLHVRSESRFPGRRQLHLHGQGRLRRHGHGHRLHHGDAIARARLPHGDSVPGDRHPVRQPAGLGRRADPGDHRRLRRPGHGQGGVGEPHGAEPDRRRPDRALPGRHAGAADERAQLPGRGEPGEQRGRGARPVGRRHDRGPGGVRRRHRAGPCHDRRKRVLRMRKEAHFRETRTVIPLPCSSTMPAWMSVTRKPW